MNYESEQLYGKHDIYELVYTSSYYYSLVATTRVLLE